VTKIYVNYWSVHFKFVNLLLSIGVSTVLWYLNPVFFFLSFFFHYVLQFLTKGTGPIAYLKEVGKTLVFWTSNGLKPTKFVLQDNSFQIPYETYLIEDIKEFIVSRGGSEPKIILNSGRTIDIGISWLRKDDQVGLSNNLDELING